MARGDEEFAEFAQASSSRLLHAAYLLTGDRHTAEDAAQTALVRTYAAWTRVRRDDAFAYARRILVNHVTDRWRRRREYATGALPDRPTRGDVAEEVAQRQWLIGALGTLTARERAVVIMRYFFDLPEANVAAELHITIGTVKSTSSRALAKLRISADEPSPAAPSAHEPSPAAPPAMAPAPARSPAAGPSPASAPLRSPASAPSPYPAPSTAPPRSAAQAPSTVPAPVIGRDRR